MSNKVISGIFGDAFPFTLRNYDSKTAVYTVEIMNLKQKDNGFERLQIQLSDLSDIKLIAEKFNCDISDSKDRKRFKAEFKEISEPFIASLKRQNKEISIQKKEQNSKDLAIQCEFVGENLKTRIRQMAGGTETTPAFFTFLGTDGKYYYFGDIRSQFLKKFTLSQMEPKSFIELAEYQYWIAVFWQIPTSEYNENHTHKDFLLGPAQWSIIFDAMVIESKKEGFFDIQNKLRLPGFYIAENRSLIVNNGDSIIYEGHKHTQQSFSSQIDNAYFYQTGKPIYRTNIPYDFSVIKRSHDSFLAFLNQCGFIDTDAPRFFLSWIYSSMLGAVNPTRPHLALIGAKGSGKSSNCAALAQIIAGNTAFNYLGGSTEPGIRDDAIEYGNKALYIEEAANNRKNKEAMDKIIQLIARPAFSSDVSGRITKFNLDKSKVYEPSSQMMVVGVSIDFEDEQDASRFTKLLLKGLKKAVTEKQKNDAILFQENRNAMFSSFKEANVSDQLIQFFVRHFSVLQHNQEYLKKAFLRKYGDSRTADILSVTIAPEALITYQAQPINVEQATLISESLSLSIFDKDTSEEESEPEQPIDLLIADIMACKFTFSFESVSREIKVIDAIRELLKPSKALESGNIFVNSHQNIEYRTEIIFQLKNCGINFQEKKKKGQRPNLPENWATSDVQWNQSKKNMKDYLSCGISIFGKNGVLRGMLKKIDSQIISYEDILRPELGNRAFCYPTSNFRKKVNGKDVAVYFVPLDEEMFT